jgi:hypothetical protein
MQECLNDERRYIAKKFRKHPLLLSVVTLVIVAIPCIFTTLAILCNVKLSCSEPEITVFLNIGMNTCMIITIFIIIPFILSLLLNCMFRIPKPVRVRKKNPLSVRRTVIEDV